MKIWKAELNLFNKNFGKREAYKFSFESDGEEYELNSLKTEYYLHFDGWICEKVPINMTYENTAWGLQVTQGFTEDKTEEEQEKIKQDMIAYMREYLIKERNKIVKSYDKKIASLK